MTMVIIEIATGSSRQLSITNGVNECSMTLVIFPGAITDLENCAKGRTLLLHASMEMVDGCEAGVKFRLLFIVERWPTNVFPNALL